MAEVNPNFLCPITQELMREPVMDREGNSYEREAIEAWIASRGISPITRSPLSVSDLVVNRSLRSAIEDYLAAGGRSVRGAASATPVISTATSAPETVFTSAEANMAPLPALDIEITAMEIQEGSDQHYVMASIISPGADVQRIPSDIVCVIDVSGSMGGQATAQGVSAEAAHLSLLDLVKHAVKTIINTLGDSDRLAIISFSDAATVVCQLTLMTATGRARATELLQNLQEGGMTNLWDGLLNGLNILKNREAAPCAGIPCDARNACVMLLTDGQPSIEPPRGHLPMLKRYRDAYGGRYPGTINTFGFGYSLDSKLLADVAIEGGGMYSFIPDAGFVGTAFVHALANSLATVARDVVLQLEPEDGVGNTPKSLLGYPSEGASYKVSWGFELPLGTVQAGQSISNIVRLSAGSIQRGDDLMSAQIAYRPSKSSTSLNATNAGPIAAATLAQRQEIAANAFRLRFIATVSHLYTSRGTAGIDSPELAAQAVAVVEELCVEMRDWLATTPECPSQQRIVGLLADLDGQVKEAVSKPEQFKRWGRHYLPSLCRAHQLQQCNNFKDPGLQFYGGDLFQRIRDIADDIFSDLPPPSAPPGRRYSQSSASQSSQQFSMRSFNSRDNPCVHEDSLVLLADGKTSKKARDVSRGDILFGDKFVECVVETLCTDGRAEMSTIKTVSGGLRITPWHPVREAGAGNWAFPQDLAGASQIDCSAVYSFLVKNGALAEGNPLKYASEILVDSVAVATLAHGILNDSVISHEFFGSEKVVDALKKCKGFNQGRITFSEGCLVRDAQNNVTGFDLARVRVI